MGYSINNDTPPRMTEMSYDYLDQIKVRYTIKN